MPLIRRTLFCLSALLLTACGSSGGGSDPSAELSSATDAITDTLNCAVASVANTASDLVSGPLARGQAGDIVLENSELRAIIQKSGRNWSGFGQFGGNLIDAVPKTANGELAAEDYFEAVLLGTNIESSPNYQVVEIISAGGLDEAGNCLPAIVRATGPDDLLDALNPSSQLRNMGLQFPQSADDVDLPITVETDYILNANQNAIQIVSTLSNESSAPVPLYLAEYINGASGMSLFQHAYGFGDTLLSAPCNSCRSVIFSSPTGGVSYGLIHDIPRTSTLNLDGITTLLYAADATALTLGAAGAEPPPFNLPGSGQLTLERWFVVGDGSVASTLNSQYELLNTLTGSVRGTISDANGPVAGAEIAVVSSVDDFLPLDPSILSAELAALIDDRSPATLVVNNLRTNGNGEFSGRLPPGNYTLQPQLPGGISTTQASAPVSISVGETSMRNFTAQAPAELRVLVRDVNGQPVPAKVQLLGAPPTASNINLTSVLSLLDIETRLFQSQISDRPEGIVLTEFAVADPDGSGPVTVGDTGVLKAPPGNYQISVSRGPRYSEFVEDITLTEGVLTQVEARIARVIDTPNHILADFHSHTLKSQGSELSARERVITYLAEGYDFFTPSENDRRTDLEPVIADMGVGLLIASAPNAETTTADYGHFNAWPVALDSTPANSDEPSQSSDAKLSKGAIDWAGAAPPGQDFPSAGYFGLPPAAIFNAAKNDPLFAGRSVVTQINHIETHFGAKGLAVDTGNPNSLSAGTPANNRRLDPALSNPFSTAFDAMELWVGAGGLEYQVNTFIDQNIGDWFNLLNAGHLKTFLANSNSHARQPTGLSARNFVSVPAASTGGIADAQKLRNSPHTVADAVLEGYTSGSNALYMTVKAQTQQGDIGGLEQGDDAGTKSRPLNSGGAPVSLAIDIASPTWAEYDRVAVYVNGATRRHKDATGLLNLSPARYRLCAPTLSKSLGASEGKNSFALHTVVAASDGTNTFERFESSTHFTLDPVSDLRFTRDYWLVVIAYGSPQNTRPLWPVVPEGFRDSGDGFKTRSAADMGTFAMAVSNPVYVDVDGDGWKAPGVQVDDFCAQDGLLNGLIDLLETILEPVLAPLAPITDPLTDPLETIGDILGL